MVVAASWGCTKWDREPYRKFAVAGVVDQHYTIAEAAMVDFRQMVVVQRVRTDYCWLPGDHHTGESHPYYTLLGV